MTFFKKNKKSSPVIKFIRIAFAALILFETLNMVGILHATLVYSWFGLVITAVAVWSSLEFANRQRPIRPLAWAIAFVPILLDAGGDILKFYATIPNYAWFLHYSSSGLFAVVLMLWTLQNRKKITGWDYWYAWTMVVSVGALYDLEEFWESTFLHNNRYLGGSVELIDITFDCLGALTAIIIVWAVLKVKKRA